MANKHAILATSKAPRWILCAGSAFMEKAYPDTTNPDAEEGTFVHAVGECCLRNNLKANHFPAGYCFTYEDHGEIKTREITDEIKRNVQAYVDYCLGLRQDLYGIEALVDIGHITGEEGAAGTSDFWTYDAARETLHVVDLKYGKSIHGRVSARDNAQLKIYALGIIDILAVIDHDVKKIVLHIFQPRLDHVDEWGTTREDLERFRSFVKTRGALALALYECKKIDPSDLTAGETQCRWCKARGPDCPAHTEYVYAAVADDFVDADDPAPAIEKAFDTVGRYDNRRLARAMDVVPMIEAWCKAARAKIESELFAGRAVPGYKLVEGKRGIRRWTDEPGVVDCLKKLKAKNDDIYERSLISPTTAEQRFKREKPLWWKKLQDFITQPKGKPSVAKASDKRPAIEVANLADDFAADVNDTEE